MKAMSFVELIAIIAGSFAIVIAGYWLATHYFSEEARIERRRRRSHSPIINKSNRPSVKLSVRTKKQRKK